MQKHKAYQRLQRREREKQKRELITKKERAKEQMVSNLSKSFLTLSIWHALQQPLTQRYVSLFLRKYYGPSQ